MTTRKGILLAGGTGSRLLPLTQAVSKQLLPIYDKPMIFYPLSLMIEAGIEEIALITTPQHRAAFEACLGDGRAFGISVTYIVQPNPDGLAQAYILSDGFLRGAPSMMVLGDNLFCGAEAIRQITSAAARPANTVFGYPVLDPQNYGVATFDAHGRAVSLDEKPERPGSDCAITGLYLLDGDAPQRARQIRPSARGELEITDLLQSYLDSGGPENGGLDVVRLSDGRWFDTGSPLSLLDASNYVRNRLVQHRQITGSPEIAAFQRGLITADQVLRRAGTMRNTEYGQILRDAVVAGTGPDARERPLIAIA